MASSALENPPEHIGLIMDGNGRWAKARGLSRTEGHKEGLKVAKRIVKAAEDFGVKYLSLYTFSTENWKRTSDEVGFLMGLLRTHLAAEFDFYRENGVRIVHSGNLGGLPPDVAASIRQVMVDTASFSGITVNLAINYGGRDEIIRAIRTIAAKDALMDEAFLRSRMDVPDMPDPDLIIRTGGEHRLSNFLIWQAAYSELYFSDVLWPDWTAEHLGEALELLRHEGTQVRRHSMRNIINRLLLVVVAIPVLYSLALFVPFMRLLPICVLATFFAIGAGIELLALLEPDAGTRRKIVAGILSGAPSLAAYLAAILFTGHPLVLWVAAAGSICLLLFMLLGLLQAFRTTPESIADGLKRTGSNAILIFYPGLLASALIPLATAPDIGGKLIVWFSLVVFLNDSLAWLVGISIGRHRGIFSVSPNKSLEGLIAGLAGSVIAAIAGPVLFSSIVPARWMFLVFNGFICGLFVVAGDLFESSLKRAAAVKDSGSIIPGRGGFLDSFDSIMFTAPVFAFMAALMGLL